MSIRVLHVIRGLANSSGTTHIVIPLAEAQARLGCRVTVLHVAKPPVDSLFPNPELVQSRCFGLSLPFNNPGFSLGFARSLGGHVAASDVVHIHAIWNFPTYWTMRKCVALRKPFMVAPQGSLDPWALRQNRRWKSIYAKYAELPLMARATRMQALTEKEAQQFHGAGIRTPVSTIPNGVELRPLANRMTPGQASAGAVRNLLFLSRVHPKKGLDLLLEAVAVLSPEFPQLRVTVAGDDAGSGYRGEMVSLATRLGLDRIVRFVGEVRGSAKHQLLDSADAFILVSRSEGLPIAALEALAAGLPCILSDQCNLPEIAEYRAGWVIPPSAEGAGAAIRSWLRDVDGGVRMGHRGRALVEQKFSWARIAELSIATYGEMLELGARGGR